ncbi:nondiscriminating glutamyl-tRNA synthetase EARS2, mitochondrial-like [Haliotis asinina]|uniref:nondiscriminating glutamyl-tRNA synthetase EARS2, mitochondrial-like n=1 Tax=Haliotis asinina TaxID=109174 RepID=UPI0035325C86
MAALTGAWPVTRLTVCLRRGLHTARKLGHQRCVRVRFAPSPTGMLHLGGLRTALYNYLFAKSNPGGKFLLRIEDTDQTRLVPEAVEKLEEMLSWAGISPDEGPSQGGNYGPYKQSERIELYQESIKVLIQNESAYHCFCTPRRLELVRKEAARRGETPRYDNRCRQWSSSEVKEKLARNTPYVIRLKLEDVAEPWDDLLKGRTSHNLADAEGDPVLLKSDKFPTYHLANVVDDHHMGITHVLRGDEWQTSTPKHLLLYKSFGWDPPRYAHLPLILNKDGTKLSKRGNDIQVEHFKNEGYYPEAVLNYVTKVGGGFSSDGTTGYSLEDMIQQFSLEKLRRNSGRLDPEFLDEANRVHLGAKLSSSSSRQQVIEDVRMLVKAEHARSLGEGALRDQILSSEYIGNILDCAFEEGRIMKPKDLLKSDWRFLWSAPQTETVQDLKSASIDVTHLLECCCHRLSVIRGFDVDHLQKELQDLARGQGHSARPVMHSLRQALSGLKEGPRVVDMMMALGRDHTVQRLKHTLHILTHS